MQRAESERTFCLIKVSTSNINASHQESLCRRSVQMLEMKLVRSLNLFWCWTFTGALAAGHLQEKSEAALRSLLSRRRLHFLRLEGKHRRLLLSI